MPMIKPYMMNVSCFLKVQDLHCWNNFRFYYTKLSPEFSFQEEIKLIEGNERFKSRKSVLNDFLNWSGKEDFGFVKIWLRLKHWYWNESKISYCTLLILKDLKKFLGSIHCRYKVTIETTTYIIVIMTYFNTLKFYICSLADELKHIIHEKYNMRNNNSWQCLADVYLLLIKYYFWYVDVF